MKSNYIKRSISFFLLAIVIYGLVFFYFNFPHYLQELEFKRDEITNNEKALMHAEKTSIMVEFEDVISDLLYLADTFEVDYENPIDRKKIADKWCLFVLRKKVYDQVRFIEYTGKENIRVNYDDNIHAAEKESLSKLQDKGKKSYFKNSIILNDGEVYVSRLDLNMENGAVELPLKPVIRFALPVFNKEGSKIGIIVINYKANNLLAKFNYIAEKSSGRIELLNQNSYYFLSNDSQKEWAFMYDDKLNLKVQDENIEKWNEISNNDFGNAIVNDELVVYRTMDLNELSKGLNDVELVLEEDRWHIVSTIDSNGKYADIVMTDKWDIFVNFLSHKKASIISIIILSILTALSLTYIYIKRKEIIFYSQKDSLTKAYNRRVGYKNIDSLYKRAKSIGKPMSICFIDINGLKLINDNLGHDYGDEIIVTIAKVLNEVIRDSDILIRLGGDEFLLGLFNADANNSELVWSRIYDRFKEINEKENRPYFISASHGIVELDYSNKKELDKYISMADELMYEEKRKIKENIKILKD